MHDVSARVLGFLSWQPFGVWAQVLVHFVFTVFVWAQVLVQLFFTDFVWAQVLVQFFFAVFLLNNCFDHFQRFPG